MREMEYKRESFEGDGVQAGKFRGNWCTGREVYCFVVVFKLDSPKYSERNSIRYLGLTVKRIIVF